MKPAQTIKYKLYEDKGGKEKGLTQKSQQVIKNQ